MFIAKNNDLIILAKDTREELESALKFMVYTDIEETETEYTLYNGQYLTPEELAEAQKTDKTNEINRKISELEKMVTDEILFGNEQNVQVYRDVIQGLKDTRDNL